MTYILVNVKEYVEENKNVDCNLQVLNSRQTYQNKESYNSIKTSDSPNRYARKWTQNNPTTDIIQDSLSVDKTITDNNTQ